MTAATVNGIPTLGGQDFAALEQNEQNVIRAMWRRLRKLDAVLTIDPITTADATNLATAITLANDTKAKVNEIIAALAERTTL